MRIALVISSLWRGGAERVMSLLANHCAARGDSVVLITYERSSSDYLLDARVERVSLDLNQVSNGFVNALLNNWRRLVALRKALRESGASVVISFEERMNAFAVLVTIGLHIRCIVSERTDPRRHDVGFVWALLRRLTYPFADALIVQTEAVRPWARGAVLDKGRVHVVPNPVRCMKRFVRIDAQRHCPIVVGVGRLVTGKGFDVLMHAFHRAVQAHPDWRLVIVGEGPERQRLERLAQELGMTDQMTITGWIAEPGDMLRTADIFVLSSHYEGFPNALLEAMACAVPVIATSCAGASEIITDDFDGLLVPVNSISGLAGALERLMTDRALRLSLGARALAAAQRYKIKAVMGQWDEVITEPIPRAGAGLMQNRRG